LSLYCPRIETEKRKTCLLALDRFFLFLFVVFIAFNLHLHLHLSSRLPFQQASKAKAKMATPAPTSDAAAASKPATKSWKFTISGPLILERCLLVAGFVILVIVNVAAGASNRRVSDRFSTPITPAGWAFSIWGLIFFLQAVGVVYAAIPWGYGRADLDGGAKGRHVAAVALPWFCGVSRRRRFYS